MFRLVFVPLISGLLACLCLLDGCTGISLAQTANLTWELPDAVRESVRNVDERIVTIQIWGAKQTKEDLQTANHLTGFIVSGKGDQERFIVTTLFGFDPIPSAILLTDAQGNRQSGTVVARDFLHKLVLLKTASPSSTDQTAAPYISAPPESLQSGQWVVACGRVFSAWTDSSKENQPTQTSSVPADDVPNKTSQFNVNVSIGILSATGRIGGLAIQTDAAVSPNNYGGPLLNLKGQVLGVLTPLSPEDESAMAGFEWYDSGIGFAIPIVTVELLLPRWKQGQDLYPGWAGFGVETKNPAISAPISAGPPAGSPAQKAGLIKGDRIVALEGQDISTMAQGIRILNRKFAGEEITVVVKRTITTENKAVDKINDKPIEQTLTLKMTLERRPKSPTPTDAKPTVRKVEREDNSPLEKNIQPGTPSGNKERKDG